jgi:hypothetical protein
VTTMTTMRATTTSRSRAHTLWKWTVLLIFIVPCIVVQQSATHRHASRSSDRHGHDHGHVLSGLILGASASTSESITHTYASTSTTTTPSKAFLDQVPEPSSRRSLVRVNPQNIVHLMVKHGGLVLSASALKDLEALAVVCRCDKSYLDILRKELEVTNFTIRLPGGGGGDGRDAALRVGRLFLKWDSYLRPALEIVVEDIDVLVEFLNLVLTNTNWNELKERYGFPPLMLVADADAEANSDIRIRGLYLLGRTKVSIKSRPLNKPIIPDAVLQFQTLDELMTYVNNEAVQERPDPTAKNHYFWNFWSRPATRQGLTMDEFANLLGEWSKIKVNNLITETTKTAVTAVIRGKQYLMAHAKLDDGAPVTISTNGRVGDQVSRAVSFAKKMALDASHMAQSYADDAADFTEQQVYDAVETTGLKVHGKVSSKLSQWGLSVEDQQRMLGQLLFGKDGDDSNPVSSRANDYEL